MRSREQVEADEKAEDEANERLIVIGGKRRLSKAHRLWLRAITKTGIYGETEEDVIAAAMVGLIERAISHGVVAVKR